MRLRLNWKHYTLLFSLLLFTASFLFVGRQHEAYFWMMVVGFLGAVVSFIIIMFSRLTWKVKLSWLVFLVGFGIVHSHAEAYLVRTSYWIFIQSNQAGLAQINKLLLEKNGNIFILRDDVTAKDDSLSEQEKLELMEQRKLINVIRISKVDRRVVYHLWWMLDESNDLIYHEKVPDSLPAIVKISDNWQWR